MGTLVLVAAAVVFGMVLASSAELTSFAAAEPQPVRVAAATSVVPSFADLAEAVSPTVVSIEATSFETRQGMRGPQGNTDPFEFFFGPRRGPQPQPEQREFRSDSGGSGFVISADGLVVTNYHVVRSAEELNVELNGRQYEAVVQGSDPETDLALLRIQGLTEEIPYLELGADDSLRVGDWIMVIGSPLSLDHTVTVGVVSALGRSGLGLSPAGDSSFENFIQTDAAINFGNSGGPIVNLEGQVVGIATAINYGAENIGFAVPVKTLKQILPALRDEGQVRRGYLGVSIDNLDYRAARSFGLDSTDGALVSVVHPDTPAARAGVEAGDIVRKVDDQEVRRTRDLIDYVAGLSPDSKTMLTVLRGGEEKKIQVQLTERPAADVVAAVVPEEADSSIDWLQAEYQNLTPGLRSRFGIPEDAAGVWISDIAQTSPLFAEGVRVGDVISEVNGAQVSNVETFERAVSGVESGGFLRLYVETHRVDPPAKRFAFVEVP